MAEIPEIVNQKEIDKILALDTNVIKADESTKKWIVSIDAVSASLKKAGITIKDVNEAQKKTAKATTKLTQVEKDQLAAEKALLKQKQASIRIIEKQNLKLAQEEAAIKKVSKSVDDLKAKNKALLAERNRLDRSTKKGTAEFNRLTAALNRNQRAIAKARISTRGLSNALKRTALQIGGALGLTGGLFVLVRAFGDVIRRIRTFDKAMQNIAGILGTTRKDLSGLEKEIRKVAGESIKTSNEVAELATTLIVLGKSKEEVIQLLKPVNDLSIALEATSQEAGELLIKTLNAFGEGNKSAQRFADVIAKMRTSTALDFEKIKDSLAFLAPVAKVAGISFEKTGAILGVLVDNSIKAAKAGRLTASSFLRLAKEGLTLDDALDKINEAQSRGIKETELLSIATKLFGVNAGAIGLILANNRDEVEDLTKEFENAKGTLDSLTKEQLKSLDARLKILDSTWERWILTIDSGNGFIASAIRTIVSLTTAFINLNIPADSLTEQFSDQSRKVKDLQENISPLLDRYDELKTKTELSKDEQEELKTAFDDIAKAIPTSITRFGQWGVAVDISTESGRDFIKMQIRMNEILNADAIKEQELALGKTENEIQNILETLEKGSAISRRGFFIPGVIEAGGEAIKLTGDEILKLQARLQDLKLSKEAIDEIIKGFKGIADAIEKSADDVETIIEESSDNVIQLRIDQRTREIAVLKAGGENTIALQKENIRDQLLLLDEFSKAWLDKKNELRVLDAKAEKEAHEESLKIARENAKEALKIEFFLEEEQEIPDVSQDPQVLAAAARNAAIVKLAQELAAKEIEIREITDKEISDLLSAGVINFDEAQALKTQSLELGAEREKEIREALKQAAIEAAFAIFEIRGSFIERELQRVRDQRSFELQLAGDNADARAKINAKFEKKESELARKKAVNDKLATAFRVTLHTIEAVAEASPLVPLMIIAAALGAIQLAVVAAQPIPQFYTGTESVPTKGVISVAEKGREMITTKSGQMFLASKPTLLSGIQGAKIDTNKETERILSSSNIGYDSPDLRELVQGNKDIVKAIKNIPQTKFELEQVVTRIGNYQRNWYNRKLKGIRD